MDIKITGTPDEIWEFLRKASLEGKPFAISQEESTEEEAEEDEDSKVIYLPDNSKKRQRPPSKKISENEVPEEIQNSIRTLMQVLVSHPNIELDDLRKRAGIHTRRFESCIEFMKKHKWLVENDDGTVRAGSINNQNHFPPRDQQQTKTVLDVLSKYPQSTSQQIGQRSLMSSSLVAARLLKLEQQNKVKSTGEGGRFDPKRWAVVRDFSKSS